MAEVDHAKRAFEMLFGVRDEQATERGLRIAEAQVYATLALVAAVNRQTKGEMRKPPGLTSDERHALRAQMQGTEDRQA